MNLSVNTATVTPPSPNMGSPATITQTGQVVAEKETPWSEEEISGSKSVLNEGTHTMCD